MNKRLIKNHVFTEGCANLFEDMGSPSVEAADLQRRSMLMNKLVKIIHKHKLTVKEGMQTFGVREYDISNLVRGRIGMFSVKKLIQMLETAGYNVTIKVARKK